MTSIDHAIITRKLRAITKYLNALQPRAALDIQTYTSDFEQQLITERLLHLIVEAAADANTYLLTASGQPPPETYFNSFIEVGRHGIITPELATKLAPSAGLRNRLVHEYEDINPHIVFQSIRIALEIYPEYIQQVQIYLERQNAP
jgi:uncharacterized protein YutE (UPF0331/DUF86 family)